MNARLNGVMMIGTAVVAALAIGLGRAPRSPHASAAAPEPSLVWVEQSPGPAVQPERALWVPGASQAGAPQPPSGLAAAVERLARTDAPRDAYAAFGLLARCMRAREFDTFLKSMPMGRGLDALRSNYADGGRWLREACSDLSMAQLATRIDLAEKAARAGVPGAASAWIEQGPFGDKSALDQRPDDPLVAEWVQQAITWVKSGATHDDIDAIVQLGMLSLNWELSDIERVKLLVNTATQRDLKDQLQRLVKRDAARADGRDRAPP